jgi:hypothetical protein
MTPQKPQNRDSAIAALAYRYWEEEGRPEGRAEQHWLRAALAIDAPAQPKTRKAAAAPAKPAVKAAAKAKPVAAKAKPASRSRTR